jgi:hypothetical protein
VQSGLVQQRRVTANILAVAVLMFITQSCQAGLSGRFDTLVTLDNREFQSRARIEEQLDLNYEQPSSGLRSGLSLGLRQHEDGDDAQVYQLYLEKNLNSKGDAVQLGRFQNADALGFYTLDGVRLKSNNSVTTLMLYGGVPRRIESLYAIDGDALLGADLYVHEQKYQDFMLDGRFGWQALKQNTKTADRLNFGLRGKWLDQGLPNQERAPSAPLTFSLAGTYLANEKHWEAFQVNTQAGLANDAYLRLDYETYEPGVDVPTFRDRFYSLYGRQRQTQLKAGYRFNTRHRHTWSLSGRHIIKEVGDNGYGGALAWRHHNDRGLHIEAQLDHLAISEDSATSLYVETKKALAAKMRGVLGAVLQRQQKRLTGENHAVGFEAQLEQLVRIDALPSDLLFSTQLSHIWNSCQKNEYRIAVRVSYSFTELTRSVAQ